MRGDSLWIQKYRQAEEKVAHLAKIIEKIEGYTDTGQ